MVVVGVDVDVDDDEAVDADPAVWEGMESGAGAIAMPVGLGVVYEAVVADRGRGRFGCGG